MDNGKGGSHEGRRARRVRGLPVRFENHIFIDKPVAEVFAFVADFRNAPKWNHAVCSMKKVTDGPVNVGTRYQQIMRNDEQRLEVTAFKPPRLVKIETLPRSVPAFKALFRLEAKGVGTTLYSHWELDTAKHRLLARLIGLRAAREALESLYRLKEILEKGSTTLQDGRTVNR